MYSVLDAFDPDRLSLWQTQMPALLQLRNCRQRGALAGDLRTTYLHCAHQFPELYEGVDFDAWCEFLQAEQLVTRAGPLLIVTPAGTELIEAALGTSKTAEPEPVGSARMQ
jgi:hypothetical protein